MRLLHRGKAVRMPLGLAASLALAGCAVLTVDVDVYKGALSNHKSIQLQQMVTLATAAKPLLIELRDRLEWRANVENCRERAIRDLWYRPGHVSDLRLDDGYRAEWRGKEGSKEQSADSRTKGFKRPVARRVNALLSLYENAYLDVDSTVLADFNRAFSTFLQDAQAFDVLTEGDDDLLRAYREHPTNLRAKEETQVAVGTGVGNGQEKTPTSDYNVERERALAGFLERTSEFRDVRSLLGLMARGTPLVAPAQDDYSAGARRTRRILALPGMETFLNHAPQISSGQKEADQARIRFSSNWAYETLANRDVAKEISRRIFIRDVSPRFEPDRVPWAKVLEDRLLEIARLYGSARLASDQFIENGLILLDELQVHGADASQRAPLAYLLASFIEPSYVVWLYQAAEAPDDLKGHLGVILSSVAEGSTSKLDESKVVGFSAKETEKIQLRLAHLLEGEDSAPAAHLLRAHRVIKDLTLAAPSMNDGSNEVQRYMEAPQRRRYGLARGVTLGAPDRSSRDFRSLRMNWRKFNGSTSLGLEEARLREGIDELVRAFIDPSTGEWNSRTGQGGSTAPRDEDEEQLVDALVRFSNKLLVLANHNELLEAHDPAGIVPTVLGIVTTQLIGGTRLQQWFYAHTPFTQTPAYVRDVKASYARVLQATGNSILVLANEHRVRMEADRRDLLLAGQELSSVRAVIPGNASEVIQRVTRGLSSEYAEVHARLVAARAALVPAQAEAKKAKDASGRAKSRSDALLVCAKILDAITRVTGLSFLDATSRFVAASHSTALATTKELAGQCTEKDAALASAMQEVERVTGLAGKLATTLSVAGEYQAPGDKGREGEPLATLPPDGAMEAFVAWIAAKSEAGNIYESALAIVSERRFAFATLGTKLPENPTDPRIVMDSLLGALQHEYLQTVLNTGAESLSARRLRDAYEVAVARRASLVRILPATSYLKSSFPATTLQDDPGLGDTNMLRKDGVASIPLLSEIQNMLFPSRETAIRIQSEIDKQNWQNINRVRVRAKGSSNLALAKDDLGNWYVKSFSSSAEQIFQSARNLGLASLGMDQGIDFLSRAQRLDAVARGQAAPPSALERTGLGRLAKRHSEIYSEGLIARKDRLAEDLADGKLTKRIEAAWAALEAGELPKEWAKVMEGVEGSFLQDAASLAAAKIDRTNDSKSDDEPLELLTSALSKVLRFHSALDSGLKSRVESAETKRKEADENAKEAADALAKAEAHKALKSAEVKVKEAELEAAKSSEKKQDSKEAKELVAATEAKLEAAKKELAEADSQLTLAEKTAASATAEGEAAKKSSELEAAGRRRAAGMGRELVGDHAAAIQKLQKEYQASLDFLAGAVDEEEEKEASPTPTPNQKALSSTSSPGG